ncbi:hypothetical protein HOY80DRAFT_1061210 [Tuber brumale]|nr:hypothetical protein HOY80DRAFT_1061210 [Tuber brumale]
MAIQGSHWPSPARALIRTTLAVTVGSIILLMNLAFLRRNFAALKTWAQRSVRKSMAWPPEPKGYSKEPTYQESGRPGNTRKSGPKASMKQKNAARYSRIMLIMTTGATGELSFIIRTLRRQEIKKAGHPKKFVRVSWAPILILQLVLVMLADSALPSLAGLVHRKAVWLWTGDGTAEDQKAAKEVKNLTPQPEGDGEILRSKPDTPHLSRGAPVQQEIESDAAEQWATMEATEAHPCT